MKKLFIAAALILSVVGYSQSKEQDLNQEIRTSKEYKKELSTLKMSLDQETQYFQLVKKYIKLNDELFEANVSSADRIKKEDALEEKKYAELKNFLSEEQLTAYKKIASERVAANRAQKKH
ncbi:MAG TPA: hypothetical protein VJL37_04145 [Flavobacterium sp.]|nr:hypothetical protein [Flavobacterium sp.]